MVTIAFFGTPAFAVPTLEALIQSAHRVAVVITQPDRPAGRGQRPAPPPVKLLAMQHRIPVLQPARLKEPAFLEAFGSAGVDLGVVAAYGKILPPELLSIPPMGLINVHASLLPKYRGAAPVHRAVMTGETRTGVTIMRVVEALDAGPMLAQAERPVGLDETSEAIERDLARLGARLLVRTVDDLASGGVREIPQDPAHATYAPRLTKQDGLIDWGAPALQVHNQVRGLHPWPHAFTYLGADRYVVLETQAPAGSAGAAPPGTVVEARGDLLLVAAGDEAAVAIRRIQPEGRRAMSAREFLAGHPVRPGMVFTRGPS